MAEADPYTDPDPDLLCDIVMKGGITSGVVYPGAVLSLAKRYRFKRIGGTSAGGIAAAIVAAAEHARHQRGFEQLATLPSELAGPADGQTLMLQLFQPDPSTRKLFSTVIGFLRYGRARALARLLCVFPGFPLLGLALAVATVTGALVLPTDSGLAVGGVLIGLLLALAGPLVQIAKAVMGGLPRNDFGLCRLGPDAGSSQTPALTAWLHRRIQETAGRGPLDPPLTFADLWAGADASLPGLGTPERTERLLELSRDEGSRVVDLQMMTTDLTHGLPMRLPSPYQQHAPRLEYGGGLLFDPQELGHFFPGDVIEHLLKAAPGSSEQTAAHLAQLGAAQLVRFPVGPDLPIVVATRMTLSFPVLISTVPLYELDFQHGEPPRLVKVRFSDGGITSNFPVHFFDSPLPTHPTFGLDLTGFDPGEAPEEGNPCAAVREPPPVTAPAYRAATEIDGLAGFFTAIKDAMQNWRDNAQSQLPGFRDRVAQIKLAKDEGGLNLTMKREQILALNARGACAGDGLVELFVGDGSGLPEHWNDHRFVRYRTSMALLEHLLREYKRGYDAPPDSVTKSYPDRVAVGLAAPYALSASSLALALSTSQQYVDLVEEWELSGATLDGAGVPRPPSTLRAVPPV